MGLMQKLALLWTPFDKQEATYQQDLLRSLLVMAWMVEARDPYTGGHLWRVSQFASLLARDAQLPPKEVARVAIGGFLHDLGKVGVPDAILGKKDKLSDEEFAVIKTHPEVGWRMLTGHPLAPLAEAAIRAHHEMPNGKGYPLGLSGAAIPMVARMVGVCDAFDAMTSTRPYRKGMPVERALDIIEGQLDQQFDRDWGQRLLRLGRAGDLDHIVGHSDEGIPLQECLMCGPILVVRQGHQAGQKIYCRSCTAEYQAQQQGDTLRLVPTGARGQATDLEPDVDAALIQRFVHESAHAVAAVLAAETGYSAKS